MIRLPHPLYAAVAVCLTAAGCSRGVATVSGVVKHGGKSLAYGTVMMSGSDGITRSGNIEPDGRYSIADVPAGTVRIAVVSPEPPDTKPDKTGKAPPRDPRREGATPPPIVDRAKWVKIPDKYGNVTTSGLTATVPAGPFTHDINLP